MPVAAEEYKMWLAVRTDITIPAGKLAVQSGHAFQLLSVHIMKTNPELMSVYMTDQSVVKIAVKAKSENHLLKIAEKCKAESIPYSLIKDAGRTVFNEPTYTVCAFGPHKRSELPSVLDRLQLYGV